MLLGVHCSISGGLENAIEEAKSLGIPVFQLFTKNQRMWREKEYDSAECESFKRRMQSEGMVMAFSHTSYLLNLATGDPELRKKSITALANELTRCHDLGLPFAVLHPGSNRLVTEDEAIGLIADGLNDVFSLTSGLDSKVLLENTAGQGTTIGKNFNQIRRIIERVEQKERLGVCLDTCHAFAAGYDIRSTAGVEDLLGQIDKEVGLGLLKAIHLNDSKGDLGGNLDRHEHIGKGKIGLEAFRRLVNAFPQIPKVIETEKVDDMDRVNLETLRSLADH